MSLDEGVSRFIGRIYESVYDADAWNSVVAEMMQRTGSRMAYISSADLRHVEYSRAAFWAPETSAIDVARGEYLSEMYRFDPSLLWAANHPDAGMCDTTKLMPREEFRRHPYIAWQMSRMGTEHFRVFYTKPVDDLTFAVSLHPPASDGPASEETASLHKLLFEHIARSLRLAARPPDLAGSADAVVILDTSGNVLTMSPGAEQLTCRGDALKVERRRLRAVDPKAAAVLNAAMLSAIRSSSLGGSGGGIRLPRTGGKPDWLALVSPSPRFLEHLPVPTPGAIVRIIETQSRPTMLPQHGELFDLSPREVEVAQGLLDGHSLESLCAVLEISRNTAKAHLQSLFRKTATNRQSELVYLLSNVTRA